MDLIQHKFIQGLTQILESIGETIEGNLICDISPRNWQINRNISKIKNLQNLCKDKKKIIEIGVNACHSLLLMLLINPHAEYLLFDLNNHRYTEPAINYIKSIFPESRINIIYGNSVNTIYKYILDNPHEINTYELIHIDGGHTEDIFSRDYTNCKQLASDNGIIIFDDYDFINIKNFINKMITKNEIIEYNNELIIKNDFHFIYKYV
jgi:predicted O-methyltransferase YrrM